MAAQRFVPNDDRSRSLMGLGLMLLGLAILGRLVYGGAPSPDGIDSRIIGTVLLLAGVGLLALGNRLSFVPKTGLAVDVESRRYVVLKHGKETHTGPLDELGPLMVWDRTRKIDKRRSITEYLVVPSGHSIIDLYCGTSEREARRKMESLAKAWRLPSKSFRGSVRNPEDLDVPLHERLRSDPTATEPIKLSSDGPVRIDALPVGYAFTSTARDSASIVIGLFVLGFGTSPFLASSPLARGTSVAALDPSERTITFVSAGLALVMTAIAGRFFLHGFRLGSLTITADGVRYRGSRMRFREIEEVTANPIAIVGDRKLIVLPHAFCPPEERDALAHEVTRLIIEVGSLTA